MKKRLMIIAIAVIGLAAVTFLFTSRKSSVATKEEPYQKGPNLARALYGDAERFTKEGNLLEAKRVYKKLITKYPDSYLIGDVRSKLDALNIDILFSPLPTEDSIFYEVKAGDTLGKIAANFGTTVELIMKSNNLANSIIRPKMRLKISNAKYSILVDKSQNVLILKTDDAALKTYAVSTGADNCTPVGTYKIINKLIDPTWYTAGAVVPPGSPENILGTRWVGLDILGYGIHGTTDETTIGRHITKGCVRMKNRDVEELYSIIPVGAEVTIIN